MRNNETVVMYDSPEAAKPHTMQGWLSRNGYFYVDEAAARYDGCTHRPCQDCGAPAPKSYIKCDVCRTKTDEDKYLSMPVAPWDGVAMVYSLTKDRFYSDPGEAEDDLEEDESLDSLRLVICEPQGAPVLETDYFCDVLPDDDYDASDVLLKAIDAFNEALKGEILSWLPGKYRLLEEQ